MEFVKDYVKDFRELTDAPDIFIRASAYHLLSFYPGRYCISRYARNLKPNVFLILSCIPGRGRRSTIERWDEKISLKAYELLNELNSEDENYDSLIKEYTDQIIEDGTPEGISDHITRKKTKVIDIRSTEFGSVLGKMNKDSGYAYGLSSFFSKLYYGESYSQTLSMRSKGAQNRNIPRGMYACMFSGMQEPYLYITPEMIREGFMRRIALCYVPVELLGPWRKPMDARVQLDANDKMDYYSERLRDVTRHYEGERVELVFDDEAMELLNEISYRDDDAVVKSPSDLTIYLQSTWEQVAKFSMLECIGRMSKLIKKEDVENAISFYNPIRANAESIVNSIGVEQPITLIKRALDRVYSAIYNAPQGIYRTALYKKMNINKNELDEYLRTLIEQGRITQTIETPNNQKVIVYRTTTTTPRPPLPTP